eukprot:2000417-Rhodomonas_salina.2
MQLFRVGKYQCLEDRVSCCRFRIVANVGCKRSEREQRSICLRNSYLSWTAGRYTLLAFY